MMNCSLLTPRGSWVRSAKRNTAYATHSLPPGPFPSHPWLGPTWAPAYLPGGPSSWCREQVPLSYSLSWSNFIWLFFCAVLASWFSQFGSRDLIIIIFFQEQTWEYKKFGFSMLNWRLPWWLKFKDFPGGSDSKESACNAGDLGLIPGWGRFPWRRKWQPTPVFLPGESNGRKSLVGYSPWGCKESDATSLALSFMLNLQPAW